MTLNELIARVRYYTNDETASLFLRENVVEYINEGIDKFRSIPELSTMIHLVEPEDVPILLPDQYHFLIAIYACAMCFLQDENEYGYTQHFMNFTNQFNDVEQGIASGKIVILNSLGEQIIDETKMDYVKNEYHAKYGEEV